MNRKIIYQNNIVGFKKHVYLVFLSKTKLKFQQNKRECRT